MKINVLLAQILLCSTLISCGDPITGNNPDVDENGTDSIPAINDTPNDSVPTDTIDPNMPETLALDSTWVRKRAGSAYGKDLAEISGMVCSRVTPGYLWVQGDDSYYVRAMTAEGKFSTTINCTTPIAIGKV
ncbi:MAG: hypothetical protein IKB46_03590 [Paludibacteraceae bacterium]|nr:hypothetical protein [Paludibacteraceae bacterium]